MYIPKVIHTFWEGKDNLLVNECINRMKSVNPDYVVKIHNREEMDKICDLGYLTNTKPQYAEYIRLYLIAKYGGVWLDATIYCVKPLHYWVDNNLNMLQGFNTPFQDNSFESWAFASPPQHPLTTAWYNEYITCMKMGYEKYKKNSPDWLKQEEVYKHMPYLNVNGTYRVAEHDTGIKPHIIDCRDSPFKYLVKHNLNAVRAINDLCKNGIDDDTYMIKFRGAERDVLGEKKVWDFCPSINPQATTFKEYRPFNWVLLSIGGVIIVSILIFLIMKILKRRYSLHYI